MYDFFTILTFEWTSNRLFVCQDENENEPEDESFRSFWIKPVTNEPGLKYNDTLKAYLGIASFIVHPFYKRKAQKGQSK